VGTKEGRVPTNFSFITYSAAFGNHVYEEFNPDITSLSGFLIQMCSIEPIFATDMECVRCGEVCQKEMM
jgi:hypothetical protein